MRRNPFFVSRVTPVAVKNDMLHLFPYFMAFLPRKTHPFSATGFFLPLTACYFESQRAIHTTTITSDINHSPCAAPVEQHEKSILNLTPEEIQYYTQNRLLAKSNEPRAYWGCASTTGFLAPEDNLLEVVQRDKATLESLGITFKQVADALEGLIRTSLVEPKKTVGELQVTVGQPTICSQYCPFSPPGADDECGPLNEPKDACGQGNRDVTITNTRTDEQMSFSALLPHLIRDHHFFEGSVPHRLAPEKIIRFLGLTPSNIGDFVNQAAVTPPGIESRPQQKNCCVSAATSPALFAVSGDDKKRYVKMRQLEMIYADVFFTPTVEMAKEKRADFEIEFHGLSETALNTYRVRGFRPNLPEQLGTSFKKEIVSPTFCSLSSAEDELNVPMAVHIAASYYGDIRGYYSAGFTKSEYVALIKTFDGLTKSDHVLLIKFFDDVCRDTEIKLQLRRGPMV